LSSDSEPEYEIRSALDIESEEVSIFDTFNEDDDWEDCSWKKISCTAHTLQLAINDAFKKTDDVRSIIGYVNSINNFFRRSPKFAEKLRERCGKGVIGIGKTRWNSILYSIQRFLEVSKLFFGFILVNPDI
jgi:hypothetical protein